jgi:hypothetical protein
LSQREGTRSHDTWGLFLGRLPLGGQPLVAGQKVFGGPPKVGGSLHKWWRVLGGRWGPMGEHHGQGNMFSPCLVGTCFLVWWMHVLWAEISAPPHPFHHYIRRWRGALHHHTNSLTKAMHDLALTLPPTKKFSSAERKSGSGGN